MKHLFFLLISLSLFACTKHREIKIIGRNAVTGQGYDGLAYKLVLSKTGNDGEVYRTEATGNLDANGEAFVSIKQRKGRSYSLRVFEPSNNCYTNEVIQSFDSPYDVNGTFTFEFAECAYLTLAVNNVDCQGSADRILFDLQPTYIENYTNIIPVEKFGCYNNTFIESQIPYGPWSATWELTKNGITTFHDSLFFIGQNEHYTFTINY
jgi:hypothetical protein